MPRLKITPSFVIWISALIALRVPHLPSMALAVLLHELGHLLFAKLLKIKISSLTLSLLGARIKTEKNMSYSDEFLLALGGPLAGFLGSAVAFFISLKHRGNTVVEHFILPFCVISICLALFNLLPLDTLDGGRMLSSLLLSILSIRKAELVLSVIGFLCIFSLWLLSVYMILKSSGGTPMLLFCVFFFVKQFIFDANASDFKSF